MSDIEELKKGVNSWNAYVIEKRKANPSWRANLVGANLAEARLVGANLAEAYLVGANLAGAYLGGANLAGAYLGGSNLAEACLVGSNLAGSNLAGSNLAEADLAGVRLADVKTGWKTPVLSNSQKAEVALAVRGECYDQGSFGDICGTTGCLAFHIVKQADGGEVFAAWFRSIPFAAMLIWPEAAHLFYQSYPDPVIEFTSEFMPEAEA